MTRLKSVVRLPNKQPSTQSLSQNYSEASLSELGNQEVMSTKSVHSQSNPEQIEENASDTELHPSINTNATFGNRCPLIGIQQRRYRITVTHSDVLAETSSSNHQTTTTKVYCYPFLLLSDESACFLLVRQTTFNCF